jgi:hypothetical protein
MVGRAVHTGGYAAGRGDGVDQIRVIACLQVSHVVHGNRPIRVAADVVGETLRPRISCCRLSQPLLHLIVCIGLGGDQCKVGVLGRCLGGAARAE